MMRAHEERKRGYTLRVGERLPEDAVGLAYVHADATRPDRNVSVEDRSAQIAENRVERRNVGEFQMQQGEGTRLVTTDGADAFRSDEILLTDEYDREDVPLYYRHLLKGRLDVRGEQVALYRKGRGATEAMRFEEVEASLRDDLEYLGSKVSVRQKDGSPLSDGQRYKVRLTQAGASGFEYDVELLTNFKGGETSYAVDYRAFRQGRSTATSELLNVSPLFERVDEEGFAASSGEGNTFLVKPVGKGFEVHAHAETVLVDSWTRPAHEFGYQVEGRLETKLTEENRGTLKVGVFFFNDSVMTDAPPLEVTAKRWLANAVSEMPGHIWRSNPRSINQNLGDQSVEYWQVNLDMPVEHYLEYDMLVLSGYGVKDMGRHQFAFQAFLDAGKTILIDNAGSGAGVSSFEVDGRPTFVSNVKFSPTVNAPGERTMTASASVFKDRYYALGSLSGAGAVRPQMIMGGGEALQDWTPLLTHNDDSWALAYREYQSGGRIIVSAIGLMRSLLSENEESLRLLTNLSVWVAETKVVRTPLFNEWVHHRNSLFTKEYRDERGRLVYEESRDDDDKTQLVAKKRVAASVRDRLAPFLPEGFRSATGTFRVLVDSNRTLPYRNTDFEETVTAKSWTSTANVFPGWQATFFSGTGTVRHRDTGSYSGTRHVEIETANGQVFIQQGLGELAAGRYVVTAWLSTEGVSGTGAKVGVYLPSGVKVATSSALSGTRKWQKVELPFDLVEGQELVLRLGFVDGNGAGKARIDGVKVESIGAVRMNRPGNGQENLYAYATTSRAQGLDLQNEGFRESDIVLARPTVRTRVAVRAYMYQWDGVLRRFTKQYGQEAIHAFDISSSEGTKTIGRLVSLVPGLQAGHAWADDSRVYYECELIGDESEPASRYVNIQVYDALNGTIHQGPDGMVTIRHNDLYVGTGESQVLLQAETGYYTIQATKRRYTARHDGRQMVSVSAPEQEDPREGWFPRVHRGAFEKMEFSGREWDERAANGRVGEAMDRRLIGKHSYEVDGYRDQIFYPSYGYSQREEILEYVDPRTVRTSRFPLHVIERIVDREELEATDDTRQVFQARLRHWRKDRPIVVRWDENETGAEVVLTTGFTIDHNGGRIRFDVPRAGIVRASYEHDNFFVMRRDYRNRGVTGESLKTADGKNFYAVNGNWVSSPAPILRKDRPDGEVLSPDRYRVHHKTGTVEVYEGHAGRLYADYRWFSEREVEVEDFDQANGTIRLKEEIHFRDEIMGRYIHEEPYLLYRGYWDGENRRFVHLDLNPGPGHRVTVRHEVEGRTVWREVPSRQLLNKAVHLYLVPKRSAYGPVTVERTDTLRHCLGETEWKAVLASEPTALLIGVIQVREHTSVENVTVLDARRRGGGLKERWTEEALESIGAESEGFWDIGGFDGDAYYERGVTVVRVPKGVLRVNGGTHTEDDVRRAVDEYLTLGVYAIIEYV